MKTTTTTTSSGKSTTAGGSEVKKQNKTTQGDSTQNKNTGSNSDRNRSSGSDFNKSLSWTKDKKNQKVKDGEVRASTSTNSDKYKNTKSKKTNKNTGSNSDRNRSSRSDWDKSLSWTKDKENQKVKDGEVRASTSTNSDKYKNTKSKKTNVNTAKPTKTLGDSSASLPKLTINTKKVTDAKVFTPNNITMRDNKNFANTVPKNDDVSVNIPKLSIPSKMTFKDMTVRDKLDAYNSDPAGKSHFTLDDDQSDAKKGYIRVLDSNGNRTSIKEANLNAAVNRGVKADAWKNKKQTFGDKFYTDDTPTAVTDSYGYSHVMDKSTAEQLMNYKDELGRFYGGEDMTYSAGRNQTEDTGLDQNNDMYKWNGAESGGYARDAKGNRLNITNLPGAVNFGNKTDSNGNVIEEPWSNASDLGEKLSRTRFVIKNGNVTGSPVDTASGLPKAIDGVVEKNYTGSGSEMVQITLPDGSRVDGYNENGNILMLDGGPPPSGSQIHTNAGDYAVGADGVAVKTGFYSVANGDVYPNGIVSVQLSDGTTLSGQKVTVELPDGTTDTAIVGSDNRTYMMDGSRPEAGTYVHTKTGTYVVSDPTETSGGVDESFTPKQSYDGTSGYTTWEDWQDENGTANKYKPQSFEDWADDNNISTSTDKNELDFDSDIDTTYDGSNYEEKYQSDLDALNTLISKPVNYNDYQTMFNSLYDAVKQQYPDVNVDRMTWDEACKQASNALKAQFDLQMQNAMETAATNLSANGFYGQATGSVLQGEMALEVEAARQGAINDMAMNFMQQDEARAEYLEQMNLERQNQAFVILQNAVDIVTNQRNADITNLFNLAQLDLEKENQAYERWYSQLQLKFDNYWNAQNYDLQRDQFAYQQYSDDRAFDYNRYTNDRDFDYNAYVNELKRQQQTVTDAQEWLRIEKEIAAITGEYQGSPTLAAQEAANDVAYKEAQLLIDQKKLEQADQKIALEAQRFAETISQNDINNSHKRAQLESQVREKARDAAYAWVYNNHPEWAEQTTALTANQRTIFNNAVTMFTNNWLKEIGLS